MNPTIVNEKTEQGMEAEATLRLIAGLPAPEGLAERVQAGLRATPAQGRVLAWPRTGWNSWRALAAAALLLAVAGGWGAYRWTRPAPVATPAPAAMRPALPGGFSAAGAIRTPQTLDGPLAPGSKAAPAKAKAAGDAVHHAKTPKTARAKAK